MIKRVTGGLSGCVVLLGIITSGFLITHTPAEAQVTVRCWKEYCVYDPGAKKHLCAKEEIPCP